MLSTHWRIGWWGKTSSTSKTALSAILRASQLGQKPRLLQLNATSFSADGQELTYYLERHGKPRFKALLSLVGGLD